MRKFYYLFNHEYRCIAKGLGLIYLMLFLLQWFLIRTARKELTVYNFIPYEEMFSKSGAIIVFYICFVITCGLCGYSIYSNYYGSKSIYTLMTLPQGRSRVFFSKLMAWSVGFITLITVQVIIGILGYIAYAPTLLQQYVTENGVVHIEERMANGLFLAFVRSDFFRIIFPLGTEGFISSIAILVSIICGLYFAIICFQSKRFFYISSHIIQLITIISILRYRINMPPKYHNLYVSSSFLFVLTGYFTWQSLRLIKQSRIV